MSRFEEEDNSVRKDLEEAFEARSLDSDFQQAFGRFMIAWSDTEAELYKVLVQYSQVTDPVARALFSGTRVKAMMAFIKSIALALPHFHGHFAKHIVDFQIVPG